MHTQKTKTHPIPYTVYLIEIEKYGFISAYFQWTATGFINYHGILYGMPSTVYIIVSHGDLIKSNTKLI